MIDSSQLRPLHDGHLGGNTGQRGARRLRTFNPFPLARPRSRRPGTPPRGTPARPQAQSGPDVRVEEPDEGQQPRFGHAQHHARGPRDVRELAAPAFSRVAGQHVQAGVRQEGNGGRFRRRRRRRLRMMAELLQEEKREEGELEAHRQEAGDADGQHTLALGPRVQLLQPGEISPSACSHVHHHVLRLSVGPQGGACSWGRFPGCFPHAAPRLVRRSCGGNDVEKKDRDGRGQQEESGREEGEEHGHDVQTSVPFHDARAVVEASHVLQSRASSARVQRGDHNDAHKPRKWRQQRRDVAFGRSQLQQARC